MAVTVDLNLDSSGYVQGAERAGRASGKLQGSTDRLSKSFASFAAAGTAIVGVGAAIAGVTAKMLAVAASVEDSSDKFDTLFGEGADKVNAFAREWAALVGVSDRTARDLLSGTQAIVKGMGMAGEEAAAFSQRIVSVAGDLASFNDVSNERAAGALQAALTGEREQLKSLGIVIREADVQARAFLQTGKDNAKSLTQQEKAAATLSLIMERAGVAIGDAERTSDSLTKQLGRLSATAQNLRDALAPLVAQALKPVIDHLVQLAEVVNRNRDVLIRYVDASASLFRAWFLAVSIPIRTINESLVDLGVVAWKVISGDFRGAVAAGKDALSAYPQAFERVKNAVTAVQGVVTKFKAANDGAAESGRAFAGAMAGGAGGGGGMSVAAGVTRATVTVKEFNRALANAKTGMLGLTGAAADHARGSDAGRQSALAREFDVIRRFGADAFKQLTTKLPAVENAFTGTFQVMAGRSDWAGKEIRDSLGSAMHHVQSLVSGTRDKFGSATRQMFEFWRKSTEGFTKAFQASAAGIAGAIGGIVGMFGTLGDSTASFGQKVAGVLAVALQGVATGKAVVAVIATLVAVVVNFWDEIKSFFSGVWDAMRSAASAAWDAIKTAATVVVAPIKLAWEGLKGALGLIFDGLKAAGTAVWNAIKTAATVVVAPIKLVWEGLKAVALGVVDAILAGWRGLKSALGVLWDGLRIAGSAVWTAIKTVAEGVWGAIKLGWEGLKSALGLIWEGLKTVGSAVWTAIKTVAEGVWGAIKLGWEGLKSGLGALWDGLKAAGTGVWNAIKGAGLSVLSALGLAQRDATDAWIEMNRKAGITISEDAAAAVRRTFEMTAAEIEAQLRAHHERLRRFREEHGPTPPGEGRVHIGDPTDEGGGGGQPGAGGTGDLGRGGTGSPPSTPRPTPPPNQTLEEIAAELKTLNEQVAGGALGNVAARNISDRVGIGAPSAGYNR